VNLAASGVRLPHAGDECVRRDVKYASDACDQLLAKSMVEVPSGSFMMGSNAHYPEESPAHEEHVAAFVSYQHPVANAEFRRFVSEAGYRTTATPPVEDISGGDAAVLVAGSLIFRRQRFPGGLTGSIGSSSRSTPARVTRYRRETGHG
jgi:formylglycine-generating enzyme required for sulfatase activity